MSTHRTLKSQASYHSDVIVQAEMRHCDQNSRAQHHITVIVQVENFDDFKSCLLESSFNIFPITAIYARGDGNFLIYYHVIRT